MLLWTGVAVPGAYGVQGHQGDSSTVNTAEGQCHQGGGEFLSHCQPSAHLLTCRQVRQSVTSTININD